MATGCNHAGLYRITAEDSAYVLHSRLERPGTLLVRGGEEQ
jgi:hypothetical protein